MKIVPKRYMNEKEMSLAMDVDRKTLLAMRKRGDIPFIKVANRIYYDPISVRNSLGIVE